MITDLSIYLSLDHLGKGFMYDYQLYCIINFLSIIEISE